VVDLVKNAAEALPEGGTIDVRTRKEGDRVALTVRDNGVGISQEDLSLAFEPLWSNKGPSSAGMGLERVKSTVDRHGGKVLMSSQPGMGTSVSILLPAEQSRKEKLESSVAEEPGALCRILLVDDLEPVVKVLARGLELVGHKVFPCLSGTRAVELFRASQFDVVICDLGMPDMNGWQVAKTLKEMAEEMNRPRTPFILLTGWGGQIRQQETMTKYGVDSVLEKPIDTSELTRMIRRVIGPA
jgi:CheY-like chemotaxis protein